MSSWLEVEDILFLICQYVATDRKYGASDLAALARTCKATSDVALDFLWKSVPGFFVLLYLLPQDSIEESSESGYPKLRLLRKTSSNEWDRVRLHANRVVNFSSMFHKYRFEISPVHGDEILSSHTEIHSEVLDKMQEYRVGFPNLAECYWPTTKIYPSPPFIHSALTRLDMNLPNDMSNLDNFFLSLPLNCPRLKHYRLIGSWRVEEDSNSQRALVQALLNLAELENFEAKGAIFDRGTLNYFASSKISNLAVKNDVMDFVRLRPVSPFFCHLRHFTASATSLATFSQFLRLVPDRLRSLEVYLKGPSTQTVIRQFFQAISETCPQEEFSSLFLSLVLDFDPIRIRYSPDNMITAPTLLSLGCFKNLKTLIMHVPFSFNLDDNDISTMACSWPHLRRFTLGREDIGWDMDQLTKRITLDGLVSLTKTCQYMSAVGLSMLASSKSQMPMDPVNNTLEELSVGSSLLDDPNFATQFLVNAYPNLRTLYFGEPWQGFGMRNSREWRMVERRLSRLNEIKNLIVCPNMYDKWYARRGRDSSPY